MANIRTQRTKAAIREAVLGYAKEKPIGDISIAEVCRRVGIDRTTFYRHYKDTDDVFQEMEQEQLAKLKSLLERNDVSTEDLINEFLVSLEKTKELYRVNEGDAVLESFKTDIVNVAKTYGFSAWKMRYVSEDDVKSEILFEAFLAGALQIAFSAEGKVDRETTVKMIMDLVEKNYERRSDA